MREGWLTIFALAGKNIITNILNLIDLLQTYVTGLIRHDSFKIKSGSNQMIDI